MPKARVNGVELFYEVSGSGQPVLFIHGGYGGAETAVVAKLPPEVVGILPSDRFKVITYDRRNAGQSEFSDAHFTLVDLADDARALLDHLDVDKAIILRALRCCPNYGSLHPWMRVLAAICRSEAVD